MTASVLANCAGINSRHCWRVWEKMRSSSSGWMTERASVCIQDSVRDGGGGGGSKSRTGTDCRVRGGRDSEVERISEREQSWRGREVKAEESASYCEEGDLISINHAKGAGGAPCLQTVEYHFTSYSEPSTAVMKEWMSTSIIFTIISTIWAEESACWAFSSVCDGVERINVSEVEVFVQKNFSNMKKHSRYWLLWSKPPLCSTLWTILQETESQTGSPQTNHTHFTWNRYSAERVCHTSDHSRWSDL